MEQPYSVDSQKLVTKDFVYINPDQSAEDNKFVNKFSGKRLWYLLGGLLILGLAVLIVVIVLIMMENQLRFEQTDSTDTYFYGTKSEKVRSDAVVSEVKQEVKVLPQYLIYDDLKLATGSSYTNDFVVGDVKQITMLFDGVLDGTIGLVGADLKAKAKFSTGDETMKWESDLVKSGTWTIQGKANSKIDGVLAVEVVDVVYELTATAEKSGDNQIAIQAVMKEKGLKMPNVAMTASIVRHSGGVARVKLFDNGKSHDEGDQDGVFGYLSNQIEVGGYTVIVEAKGSQVTRIVTVPFYSSTIEE